MRLTGLDAWKYHRIKMVIPFFLKKIIIILILQDFLRDFKVFLIYFH